MNKKWIYWGLVVVAVVVAGWAARPIAADWIMAWRIGLPAPEYYVSVDENVKIVMPDQVRLFADLYRPMGKEQFPVVIARTPYGKKNRRHRYRELGHLLAGQGIAFLIQDVRGKFDSGGEFYPHRDDAEDGKATIDWTMRQSWSDGQAALFGFSYLGVTAWQALAASEHSVKTIMPWFSGSDPYATWYDKGIPYLKQLLFWMSKHANASSRPIPHHLVDRVLQEADHFHEADLKVVGEPLAPYRDFLSHSSRDAFWEKLSDRTDKMVPALIETGWYDRYLGDSITDFINSPHPDSRLVIGPWKHDPMDRVNGAGENADFLAQFKTLIDWCRYWMGEGEPLNLAPVTYYVMEENEWRTAANWPPGEAKKSFFYLAGKEISHKQGGGRTLRFHPRSRVQNLGGSLLYSKGKDGPVDQKAVLQRKDVISWESPLLDDQLVLVGSPNLELEVRTSLPSFDLAAKLIDQGPDGKARLITDGVYRFDRAGKILLPLNPIAYAVKPGHSLIVALTHSHFPSHAPNPELKGFDSAEIEVLPSSRLDFLSLQAADDD